MIKRYKKEHDCQTAVMLFFVVILLYKSKGSSEGKVVGIIG